MNNEQCNDPDHNTINAERDESRGLRQAWRALDDKRQELEQELRTARNLADSAMWESDRLRSELHKQLVAYDALFDEAEKIRIERDKERDLSHALQIKLSLMQAALGDWDDSGVWRDALL